MSRRCCAGFPIALVVVVVFLLGPRNLLLNLQTACHLIYLFTCFPASCCSGVRDQLMVELVYIKPQSRQQTSNSSNNLTAFGYICMLTSLAHILQIVSRPRAIGSFVEAKMTKHCSTSDENSVA